MKNPESESPNENILDKSDDNLDTDLPKPDVSTRKLGRRDWTKGVLGLLGTSAYDLQKEFGSGEVAAKNPESKRPIEPQLVPKFEENLQQRVFSIADVVRTANLDNENTRSDEIVDIVNLLSKDLKHGILSVAPVFEKKLETIIRARNKNKWQNPSAMAGAAGVALADERISKKVQNTTRRSLLALFGSAIGINSSRIAADKIPYEKQLDDQEIDKYTLRAAETLLSQFKPGRINPLPGGPRKKELTWDNLMIHYSKIARMLQNKFGVRDPLQEFGALHFSVDVMDALYRVEEDGEDEE